MREKKNLHVGHRFLNAMRGITGAVKRERSLRFQGTVALILPILCLVVRPAPVWWAVFALTSALVVTLELVNTAVEALLDRFHPGFDTETGFIKDCLAGAVLIASLTSLVVFLAFVYETFVR